MTMYFYFYPKMVSQEQIKILEKNIEKMLNKKIIYIDNKCRCKVQTSKRTCIIIAIFFAYIYPKFYLFLFKTF